MMDRSRRLSEPLRWTRTGKLAVATLGVVAVLAVVGVGVYAGLGGFSRTARGRCISVTFASTTGAAELHACGERARTICSSGAASGLGHGLHAACRRAGYPYGGAAGRG
jgi:hypothetical protein